MPWPNRRAACPIVLDNRLNASEIREETYHFQAPAKSKSEVVIIRASLNYLAYPTSFTRGLGLPGAKAVEVASTKGEIRID